MMVPTLTPGQWGLACLAAICIGLSKGGFVGLGILAVLLMAEIIPGRQSTGAVLPLLICADICAVLVFQQHAQWPVIWRVLPPAVLGIIAGYFLLKRIPEERFRHVIGALVLILVVLQVMRRRFTICFERVPRTRWFGWLMGIWTGINTMLANAAGPVATLYLLALNMEKLEFVGTIAWMFLIINLVKVPFSAHLGLITPASLLLNLCLIPGVLAGIWLGRLLVGKVSQQAFEAFLLVSAAAASARLIWS